MATAKETSKKAKVVKKSTGSRASIDLDAAFYPLRALKSAAQVFSNLAQIELQKREGKYRVNFSGMKPAVAKRVPDEFANYVLALVMSEK